MKKIMITFLALMGLSTAQAAISFATQPYIQSLTPTSVTIMWVTSGSQQLTGWVEYGTTSCDQQAFEYTRGLKQAFCKIYRVHIDSLTPGTTYQYKAFIREITGFVGNTSLTWGETYSTDTYSFTTPAMDAPSVSCVVFDDIHGNPAYVDTLLAVNTIDMSQQDFVFFNGDMLNAVPSEQEILNKMLVPYAKLFASNKPFFSTRGNHEYRNKYARSLIDYLDNPAKSTGNRTFHEPTEFYYTFSWGPCYFIVLDSGEDKEDSDKEYNGLLDCEAYRASQVEWLREQLQSEACQQAQYKVVLMHIPFYSNTSTARFAVQDCRDKFMPLMNQYGVDVVINGHTHKAGVLEANTDHHFPIVIGGGKDITADKTTYCPALIQLQANAQALDITIKDYYGVNRGSVHIVK